MKYLNELGGRTDGHLIVNNSKTKQTNCPKGILTRVTISSSSIRRFTHCSWNTGSHQLLACDHVGSIYLFDMVTLKWQFVNQVAAASTSLCFNLKRNSSEYLIATTDSPIIKCYNCDNRELVGQLKGHKISPSSMVVRQKPQDSAQQDHHVLTISSDSVYLWDLRDFTLKRKLTVKEDKVGFQSGFFCGADFSCLLTVFKDQSIFIWDGKSMKKKYTIEAPKKHIKLVKAAAVSPNGLEIALAGSDYEKEGEKEHGTLQNPKINSKSRRIVIYNLLKGELDQVLELDDVDSDIVQLFYLSKKFDTATYSPTIGVLSKNGKCKFLNTVTSHEVGTIGGASDVYKIHFPSFDGGYIASLRSESASLDIYSSPDALPKVLGLGVMPLVKVVSKLWQRKSQQADQDITSGVAKHSSKKGFASCPHIKLRQTASLNENTMDVPLVKGGVVDKTSGYQAESLVLPGSKLSHKKLGRILHGYGSYPERYRSFIWRALLEIPGNEACFTTLVQRGVHPNWKNIGEKFQIKSPRLIRILEKIVSALAYWSEIFAELEYLPMLVFPFVKVFQHNHLVCFEVVATYLKSFCVHWFEFFPNPPIGVLSVIENVIAENDRQIFHHLVESKITSQTYAWPILQTAFSEVLTRDEWLVFFDNLFFNRSTLWQLCGVAGYVILCKEPLLRTTSFQDFEYFFRHRNAISISLLVKKADYLYEKTLQDHANVRFSRHYSRPFEGLTSPQYPVFNQYPEFVVDYRKKETERIRKEQKSQLNGKGGNGNFMIREIDRVREEAEHWLSQQRAIDHACNERRVQLQHEQLQNDRYGEAKIEDVNSKAPFVARKMSSGPKSSTVKFDLVQEGYELDSADLTWETAGSVEAGNNILRKRENSKYDTREAFEKINKTRLDQLG